MNYKVRYTKAAKKDFLRLYDFLLGKDLQAARRALEAIRKGMDFLQDFPFTCRKATPENPFLREMIISFGAGGYVVLFEIEDEKTVTILAVRHQREEDYH
ncbi:Plasmid stabilization system protein ParE [Geoalkalibacter ferrihydriticus]|uniref:Plasmid stabilization protein n=2 Tax=Geoalkalibacter ferrihydriticus TaxID=392333 RepID=A0A0C2HIJ3_9BACT|nr:type II toxin-antitoxin system RelE/ParE family toxin [Geoalkalibacter ferrihydriticus]KIH76861.1 plasmid stabilization protein [Geoalkalibacter ferrihydriticus DSM 17813]SDL47282.1 Plasmid stabilization system protein ParE [Geoalkalibacter ferrihydriticus]